ncbi:Methylisocitrate lyase [Serratia grimesii]|jgi:2-methylisocitrate lyase-like PEP mutase family enzyme|uniref:isocitrate lyase/PEP mutase family protein n=1 Tax=Serratia grimesii TaxID=82995 RepID=UPI00076F3D83|nr:isocitrate lyase/phosphoenolpyruvate mutase family protein [Serratia grimesii]CAI0770654.1 Methylisocitrate lyase [Serratia grimesii]CAI2456215.1 Methylisocitrate lyase [Serratia grimesii]CUW09143.1 Methylisocitrate lyase [Serratia grimesii]SMZ55885.1 Methylisocitrate lyase [Serratia grimesii]SUI32279.1 Methylisocitrate lyase [Serratia grimesii]
MDLNSNATIFANLHRQRHPLRLPNAWDAGSALLIESLGAAAIATTSAGVAWSLGYRDGDQLPLEPHLASIAAIARVIKVPLSVDIEGGYATHEHSFENVVARFIDVGAVGINIQDGAGSPQILCEKISQARSVAERLGVKLYINARTDVYARNLTSAAKRMDETLLRAKLYRDAGADGLFVLGVTDPEAIRQIAGNTDLLLNVITWPGLLPADRLAELGVRRVSVGSWIPQTLWASTIKLAAGFLADGNSEPLFTDAASYADINGHFPD